MTDSLLVRTCPVCNADGFELDQEEVDIGVGVQTFMRGGFCHGVCDSYVEKCDGCGGWGGKHESWCPVNKLEVT